MRKTILLFAIFMAVFFSVSNATITYAGIVTQAGSVVSLVYDRNSSSYADSGANHNIYLKLCANDSADLSGKYVGYVYFGGNSYVQLNSFFGWPTGSLLPILTINSSNCTSVDLDFSSTEAYYPGVPSVVISDDNTLDAGDTFFQMDQGHAFLNGTYYILRTDSGASVSVSVSSVRDQNNDSISKIEPAIVVTLLRNDTFAVLSSAVITPGQTAYLSKANYTGSTSVKMNGLFYYPNAVQPSTPPSAAMGAFTGQAVWKSFCNIPTEHTHIDMVLADTVAYGGSDYCLDLHLRSLLVNANLTDVDVYITEKALPLNIPRIGDSSTIVYATFELAKSKIDESNVRDSSFDFRVLKYWAETNGVPVSTIRLAKYNGLNWDTLSSTQNGENDAYYYFSSTSNGLSYYAIYGSKVDIWYILGVIDRYYNSTASFLDVLDAISKYYVQ